MAGQLGGDVQQVLDAVGTVSRAGDGPRRRHVDQLTNQLDAGDGRDALNGPLQRRLVLHQVLRNPALFTTETRTPPPSRGRTLIPVTAPSQLRCKHAHLYRSASAAGWLSPLSTTPAVTGQPASPSVSPASQPRPPPTTLRHRHLWF